MSSSVIAGPYLSDLQSQPAAFHALRERLATVTLSGELSSGVRTGRFRRVVLTGMGSSLHALYPLHLWLTAQGYVSHLVETAELLIGYEPFRSKDTLLIVVSQSGQSAEVVDLLKAGSAFGHIIGITNTPQSTLDRAADTKLALQAGSESTVSCKTYLNTLALLHWLAAALTTGDTATALAELAAVQNSVRSYLESWASHVAAWGELIGDVRSIFVTGRGVSLATAWTGGLILKESTRIHAEGMSCAAFRHGPLEMISDEVLVLVLSGDARVEALHRRLADDIARDGGRVALIGAQRIASSTLRLPAVPTVLLPLVEILPVQMLSLALAARDGREAGRFERATKITIVA
jgi:glutamine---fructose-6-phosphate transaminase (isomerizing)